MKQSFLFVSLMILLLLPSFVGAQSTDVELLDVASEDYFYANTFDNLVLGFNVTPTSEDVLESLVVKNEGTARPVYEIEKVVLYLDDGDDLFQGFAVDEEVGEAVYDETNFVWVFDGLDNVVAVEGQSFFVAAETRNDGTNNRTFNFSISAYYDENGDSDYDKGDKGLFLQSGVSAPDAKLISSKTADYRSSSSDDLDPVIVITNLSDNQVIEATDFVIEGQARDQGGSKPNGLSICINDICTSAEGTSAYSRTWQYDWTDIADGTYSIYAKSTDFNGNKGETDPITVTVQAPEPVVFSKDNSTVTIDKYSAVADGVDSINIDVTLKNSINETIENTLVYLNEIRTVGPVTIKSVYSDANGNASFEVKSLDVEAYELSISTEDGDSVSDTINISFLDSEEIIDYTSGRFLKSESSNAVYFLDEEDMRHIYPTYSVWQSYFGDDFSSVETVERDVLISYGLAGNVPMKAGSLMEVESLNEYYLVGENATLQEVKSEDTLVSLFGSTWLDQVYYLQSGFYTQYTVLDPIE
ncbi:hypothetical protein HN958_00920 [Candidatus Falkowbacteria bacterium]|jgi:hypothetical protein|nr:hypothetical protein [Candidatus Falkowbacteria bacterium]